MHQCRVSAFKSKAHLPSPQSFFSFFWFYFTFGWLLFVQRYNKWRNVESHHRLAIAIISSVFCNGLVLLLGSWKDNTWRVSMVRSYLHAQSIVQNLACPGVNDSILLTWSYLVLNYWCKSCNFDSSWGEVLLLLFLFVEFVISYAIHVTCGMLSNHAKPITSVFRCSNFLRIDCFVEIVERTKHEGEQWYIQILVCHHWLIRFYYYVLLWFWCRLKVIFLVFR